MVTMTRRPVCIEVLWTFWKIDSSDVIQFFSRCINTKKERSLAKLAQYFNYTYVLYMKATIKYFNLT